VILQKEFMGISALISCEWLQQNFDAENQAILMAVNKVISLIIKG